MEKSIKSNLDIFYNDLREHEIDIKLKMDKVWKNLFLDLKDIKKNYVDEKSKILKKLSKKDKYFNIMSKLFSYFENNNINIKDNDNKFEIYYKKKLCGTLKKMSNKIIINIKEYDLSIVISHKDRNVDKTETNN